ncbi:MAG: plasmid partitioning protein RepB [Roseiarcus sp.]|jgi:ParB family chromosome partitioning protein
MARKNLLTGLLGNEFPDGNSAEQATPEGEKTPAPHLGVMGTRGAIGAVTRSIEQLKAQSIVDIAPELIEASFIADRLESTPESHRALVDSIREHGQQVPVLVRPHPITEGRYQIAYGRRRLRAVAELGRRVRAVVKPLTDQQLVVAQGQENSARTDLSFIEKALFAARLEEGGFDRETIMAALSVDKTGLSRLISSAVKIPRDIIEAIGSAPRAGRDRWIELATRLENATAVAAARRLIESDGFARKDSDERFNAITNVAAPKPAKTPRPAVWKAEDGTRVAHIKEDERNLTLAIDKKAAGEFGAYLVEQLPEIYAAFKRRANK